MWVAGGAAKGAPPWRAVAAASAGVSVTRTRAVALKLLPAGRSVTGQQRAWHSGGTAIFSSWPCALRPTRISGMASNLPPSARACACAGRAEDT